MLLKKKVFYISYSLKIDLKVITLGCCSAVQKEWILCSEASFLSHFSWRDEIFNILLYILTLLSEIMDKPLCTVETTVQ